jgi:hypothetical protein
MQKWTNSSKEVSALGSDSMGARGGVTGRGSAAATGLMPMTKKAGNTKNTEDSFDYKMFASTLAEVMGADDEEDAFLEPWERPGPSLHDLFMSQPCTKCKEVRSGCVCLPDGMLQEESEEEKLVKSLASFEKLASSWLDDRPGEEIPRRQKVQLQEIGRGGGEVGENRTKESWPDTPAGEPLKLEKEEEILHLRNSLASRPKSAGLVLDVAQGTKALPLAVTNHEQRPWSAGVPLAREQKSARGHDDVGWRRAMRQREQGWKGWKCGSNPGAADARGGGGGGGGGGSACSSGEGGREHQGEHVNELSLGFSQRLRHLVSSHTHKHIHHTHTNHAHTHTHTHKHTHTHGATGGAEGGNDPKGRFRPFSAQVSFARRGGRGSGDMVGEGGEEGRGEGGDCSGRRKLRQRPATAVRRAVGLGSRGVAHTHTHTHTHTHLQCGGDRDRGGEGGEEGWQAGDDGGNGTARGSFSRKMLEAQRSSLTLKKENWAIDAHIHQVRL